MGRPALRGENMRIKITSVLVVLWICMAVFFSSAAEKEPLFHLSFEETIDAEFAKGNSTGSQKKPEDSVKYIEGVQGKAVLLENGNLYYDAKGNFDTLRGTITFWAKPVNWEPAKPSPNWVYFFSAYQRTGAGGQDTMAFWRYPENILGGAYQYHSAQGDNLDNYLPEVKGWEKGQWKFFALTWDEQGTAGFYVDGKFISQKARKKNALPVDINFLTIASSGTAYDEFRIFDRVLTDEEIRDCFVADGGNNAVPVEKKLDFPEFPPTAAAIPVEDAIDIDGYFKESAWDNTVEFRDMSLSTGSQSPINPTSCRIVHTKNSLVFGITVYQQADPLVTVRQHGGPVYTDDSIELFIAPEFGGKEYYQFVVNSVAARYEGRGMDGGWEGEWRAAARREKGRWHVEIEIPFSTVGVVPQPGKMLGFNLCRNDKSANQSQTWADLGGYAFHRPDRFGRLLLSETALGISGASMVFRKDGNVAINSAIANPGDLPVEVKWLIAGNAGGKAFRFEEIAVLQGKEKKLIEKAGGLSGLKGNAGWRSALWAGGELLYLSPARTSNFLDFPPLTGAREPITLENGKISLGFDAHSGAVVSMRNLETGLELIPRNEPQPLFSLDTVSYQKCPVFFRETDVVPMESSNNSARGCRIEKRRDGTQVFTALHEFSQGLKATVTVELPPSGEISRWSIRIENRLPLRPRDAVVVHRVAFPQMGGLRAAEEDSLQFLAWPQDAGLLVSEPARKASTLRKLESPGGASMSWTDLSGPRGGLYLAGHDVEPVVPAIFEAAGDGKNSEVALTVRRWSLLWPGKDWQPAPFSVGVHKSDWHWSADRYREWFYKSAPVRKTPQWVLDEDGWIMDGGGPNRATFADIPNLLTRAQNMGINYIQSWQHHMSAGGEEVYAMQMPNVYGGSEKEFISTLNSLHKRGGRIGFYFNAGDFDARSGGIMRQPRYMQKLPEDIVKILPAADPLADGWLEMGRIEPDGSQKLGWPSGTDMRHGCYGSKGWSDWTYFWVTRYANIYKADTWYQDITPWSAVGICFHPNHGHAGPVSHAQATIDMGNRIVKAVGKDYGIIGESMCDRFMNYQTHSLWLASIGQEDSEPALFIYTHPRFPLFSGTCAFFSDCNKLLAKNFYKGSSGDTLSFADFMSYVLLYGQRFDTFNGPARESPEYLSASLKEEKNIIMLRRAVHEDLEKSSFKDRIGLSAIPGNVEARVFVRDDGKGALVSILDFRKEKWQFNLPFDLSVHGLKLPAAAELVLPGGRVKKLEGITQQDSCIMIPLPAEGEKISMVRIKTR